MALLTVAAEAGGDAAPADGGGAGDMAGDTGSGGSCSAAAEAL